MNHGPTRRLASASVPAWVLDVLRAAAWRRHHVSPQHQQDAQCVGVWMRCGWIGVDLFFVLSGFLVGGLLFKEHRERGMISVRRFYVRRAFRIYPPFYVMMAAVVLIGIAQRTGIVPQWVDLNLGRRTIAGEALFLQNYLGHIQWHTWSLAVEEHFYVILGLLVLGLATQGTHLPDPFRRLPWIAAALAGICLGLRVWAVARRPFSFDTHLFPTHLRADSLCFGVTLAYLFHFHGERLGAFVLRWRTPILLVAVVMIAPTTVIDVEQPVMHTLGLTALCLGFGSLLLVVVFVPALTAPLAWLAPVGINSYSIYLWHLVVLGVVEHGLHALPWATRATAYLVLALAAGWAISVAVEVPTLKLRDRLFPRPS